MLKLLTVTIPVKVETAESGLIYVTSPIIRGLLVSERTEEKALASAITAVDDLARAAVERA
jgi:hypothetical protein